MVCAFIVGTCWDVWRALLKASESPKLRPGSVLLSEVDVLAKRNVGHASARSVVGWCSAW
jgi:hypothetical protein